MQKQVINLSDFTIMHNSKVIQYQDILGIAKRTSEVVRNLPLCFGTRGTKTICRSRLRTFFQNHGCIPLAKTPERSHE